MMSIFLTMLLLWVECYHKMTKTSTPFLRNLRPILVVILSVLFILELVFRLEWTPNNAGPMLVIYYSYFFVTTSGCSIGFLIYGIKLYKRVQQINTPLNHNHTKEERLRKVSYRQHATPPFSNSCPHSFSWLTLSPFSDT